LESSSIERRFQRVNLSMRGFTMYRTSVRLTLTVVLMTILAACARPPQNSSLYQYAIFDSFAAGEYAGTIPLSQLKSHGDFGLGTTDGLSGEMIVLDGVFYLADEKCRLTRLDMSTLSPFASLAFFKPDAKQSVSLADVPALMAELDARLPKGTFATAKVTARFKKLTIRSVPGYAKPYPPLGEALKTQFVMELNDVSGTLVGLRGPAEPTGAWVAGWHFHFVSADGKTGGHVLKAEGLSGEAAWMAARRFELELP
jgi:acetolactate decarboxylase